jgi:hypothetical protein
VFFIFSFVLKWSRSLIPSCSDLEAFFLIVSDPAKDEGNHGARSPNL